MPASRRQNLDLAYSIRRAGWNVLVPFYRGKWGGGGTFSVTHTLEDAQASIDFLRDTENAKKFRIDPDDIVQLSKPGTCAFSFDEELLAGIDECNGDLTPAIS